jgi:hypothetical protein
VGRNGTGSYALLVDKVAERYWKYHEMIMKYLVFSNLDVDVSVRVVVKKHGWGSSRSEPYNTRLP